MAKCRPEENLLVSPWVGGSRRSFLRLAISGIAVGEVIGLDTETDQVKLDIRNYISPRNKRRPKRPHTRYIVLHTTEGREKGSLKKIRRRGEAHYVIGLNGCVYRIIDKSRIATHAGRSYWEGNKVIDNFSIGIEVVGYHNREFKVAQYEALRELLRQLKSLYRISDRNILTHSMVAYGRPNRFHRYYHRGRKRCAMIFADPNIRAKIGVFDKPSFDPEVKAKRLRVADSELYRFLFASSKKTLPKPSKSNVISRERSAWTIARERYKSPGTTYHFPSGKVRRGDQISNWKSLPVGTIVEFGREDQQETAKAEFKGFLGTTKASTRATDLVGDAFDEQTTIYFLPSGLIRTGSDLASSKRSRSILDGLPSGTKILLGYVYGGYITRGRFPRQIAGYKWNYPSTFYRLPDGHILTGDEIDQRSVPNKTLVFFQN
jgi:N-acetylmuramoyl-L-alanine amidase